MLTYNHRASVQVLDLETVICQTCSLRFLTNKGIQPDSGHIKIWYKFPSTQYGVFATAVRQEEEEEEELEIIKYFYKNYKNAGMA